MRGTFVNALAVIVGSLAGLLLKGGIKASYRDMLSNAVGLAVVIIGLTSAINTDANLLLMVVSLVTGGLVGEAADLDGKLHRLGDFLQSKISASGSDISKGFVTASLLFCVGTMAIIGSIESGARGVHDTLYAKSVLDGISSIIFASHLGIGVMLSAVSVFIYQGALTLMAGFISPFLSADMLREISVVGGVLIAALGLNQLNIIKIKVANMIPSIIVPVLYYYILELL